MAREDTLVHEQSQNFPLERAVVSTNAYDSIKDTSLIALREMFSRHPEYTYVADPERGFGFPDLDKTRIVIWQDYPYDTLFLPCLTLNIGGMSYHPISFNQNMATIDYLLDEDGNTVKNDFGQPIPNYYEYAGAWDSTLAINVNAQSPWDRDLITDFIKINLIHVYRDWFYTRGIHVKRVSTGGEGQVDWRNQHIYKITVSAELYTEWTHRIPVPTEVVEAITHRISSPISSAPLVPEGGIIDGEKVEDFATILSADEVTVDEYNDDRPESAMDTVSYNTSLDEWEITENWWLQLARYFDTEEELEMLQTKYGINSLSDLSTEDWFNLVASVSSPFRIGYLQTIEDVQVGIEEAADILGIDPAMPLPDGYESTEYNRLLQLRSIKEQLEEEYEELVTRPTTGYGQ